MIPTRGDGIQVIPTSQWAYVDLRRSGSLGVLGNLGWLGRLGELAKIGVLGKLDPFAIDKIILYRIMIAR